MIVNIFQSKLATKSNNILISFLVFSNYFNYTRSLRFDDKPDYGYLRGFHRYVFKSNYTCDEVISSYLEHLRAFKDRDHFTLLSLKISAAPFVKIFLKSQKADIIFSAKRLF